MKHWHLMCLCCACTHSGANTHSINSIAATDGKYTRLMPRHRHNILCVRNMYENRIQNQTTHRHTNAASATIDIIKVPSKRLQTA